jgi:hypothetical protein
MVKWVGPSTAIRVALALSALLLGYFSVVRSLAQFVARVDAQRAYDLSSNDGRIMARLAGSMIVTDVSGSKLQRADNLAREALDKDPTAVIAAAVRGIAAGSRGDAARERAWFAYSETLSRRELRTQLWAIQSAVEKNDISAALHHYDVALRAIKNSETLLFPILAGATTEPTIRKELVKTLSSKPSWGNEFASYLAGNSPDLRSTALLFSELHKNGLIVPPKARVGVIDGLIGKGFVEDGWRYFVEDGWRYYAIDGLTANRNRSRDPGFKAKIENPSLFDWHPVNGFAGTASMQSDKDGGVFRFSVPASVGGPLLSQMQMLAPGQYKLEGRSSGVDRHDLSRPYWVLRCSQSLNELGRIPVPNSEQPKGGFEGYFIVPGNCPMQILEFVARPSDAVGGVEGEIYFVDLKPVH